MAVGVAAGDGFGDGDDAGTVAVVPGDGEGLGDWAETPTNAATEQMATAGSTNQRIVILLLKSGFSRDEVRLVRKSLTVDKRRCADGAQL